MWAERLLCLEWIRRVFCFAHGTECNAPQSARSHSEKGIAALSALAAAAETGGRGRLRHAVGWRVLDMRRFFQNEKCSADRLQRIILRTPSNQTAPSCETTWEPTLGSQRLLLLLLSVCSCIPWEPGGMQSASFFFFFFLDGVVRTIASLCRQKQWARVRRHQASRLDWTHSTLKWPCKQRKQRCSSAIYLAASHQLW